MFRKLHDPGPSAITIYIDGQAIAAEAGESIAAVLLRDSEPWAHASTVSQEPRAPYCMMGVCFECLVEVDGMEVQGCQTPVREGMQVARQQGRRSLTA